MKIQYKQSLEIELSKEDIQDLEEFGKTFNSPKNEYTCKVHLSVENVIKKHQTYLEIGISHETFKDLRAKRIFIHEDFTIKL